MFIVLSKTKPPDSGAFPIIQRCVKSNIYLFMCVFVLYQYVLFVSVQLCVCVGGGHGFKYGMSTRIVSLSKKLTCNCLTRLRSINKYMVID